MRMNVTPSTRFQRGPGRCTRGSRTLTTAPRMALPAGRVDMGGSTGGVHKSRLPPARFKSDHNTGETTTTSTSTTFSVLPEAALWQQIKDDIANNTILLPPASVKAAFNPSTDGWSQPPSTSQRTSCLLLVVPGSMQHPRNYLPLAQAVSSQAAEREPHLDVWVAVAGFEVMTLARLMMKLDAKDPLQGLAGGLQTLAKAQPSPQSQAQQEGSQDSSRVPGADAVLLEAFEEVMRVCTEGSGDVVQRTPTGRYSNVVVAAHSMAGALFSDVAFTKAGGLVLLESSWSHRPDMVSSGWAASSRPVLVVGGQCDGQMAWPRYLHDAAISAWTATRQGAAYAASHKAVILVPGLNHGQVCNQPAMLERGDCEASAPQEHTLRDLSTTVCAFLSCHMSTADTGSAHQHMLQQAVRTAEFLETYSVANGTGSLVGAWSTGRNLDTLDSALARREAVRQYSACSTSWDTVSRPVVYGRSVGAPLQHGGVIGQLAVDAPAAMLDRLYAVGPLSHGLRVAPTRLAEAVEDEVHDLQMLVAQSGVSQGLIPAELLQKLSVVAHVHTNLNSFLFSQAHMRHAGRGVLELQVPVFMHWPVDEKLGEMVPGSWHSYSHDLWIKMKSETSLAAEMRDLAGLPPLPVTTYEPGPHVTAADLNEHTLQWALSAVSEQDRQRYLSQGVSLVCDPDEEIQVTPLWVTHSRMTFTPTATPTDRNPNSTSLNDHNNSSHANSSVRHHNGSQGGGPLPQALQVRVRSPVYRRNPAAQPVPSGAMTNRSRAAASSAILSSPESQEARRFWGPLYVKVLSRAQALEWIQLGSVRQRTLPQHAGCRWGGYPLPMPGQDQ